MPQGFQPERDKRTFHGVYTVYYSIHCLYYYCIYTTLTIKKKCPFVPWWAGTFEGVGVEAGTFHGQIDRVGTFVLSLRWKALMEDDRGSRLDSCFLAAF